MNSASRCIAAETYQRCLDAIAKREIEGAEFDVWWDRLAALNQEMRGPRTWKRLREITEKMVSWTKQPESDERYAE
jgi:hypothetical protein